jgi:hypothetical protein
VRKKNKSPSFDNQIESTVEQAQKQFLLESTFTPFCILSVLTGAVDDGRYRETQGRAEFGTSGTPASTFRRHDICSLQRWNENIRTVLSII